MWPETQASDLNTCPVFFLVKLSSSLFMLQALAFPEIDPSTQWFHVLLGLESLHIHILSHIVPEGWRLISENAPSPCSLVRFWCNQISWTRHQETWNSCSFHLSNEAVISAPPLLPCFENKCFNSWIKTTQTYWLPTGSQFIHLKEWKSIFELPREMWFIQDVILMANFVMAQNGVLSKVNRIGKM